MMKAVSVANKHTSSYGMTTVEEIRQVLASPDNQLDASDIRRVLGRESSISGQESGSGSRRTSTGATPTAW